MNGDLVAAALDPIAAGNNVEITIDVTIAMAGEAVTISLEKIKRNPKISAILITPIGYTPPTAPPVDTSAFTPIRLNCGGVASGIFEDDLYFIGGKSYTKRNCDGEVICTERFGRTMSYHIPVPANNEYIVTATFSEVFYTETGRRVFDYLVNGNVEFAALDPYEEGQGSDAVVRTQLVSTNGYIDLSFNKITGNPKITSIQITQVNTVGGTAAPTSSPTPAPSSTASPTAPIDYPERPDTAEVVLQSVKVFEQYNPTSSNPSSWNQRKNYVFNQAGDLYNEWALSDWGFGGFDGAFDPSAVFVSDNKLILDLERN